jgi:hypothetical protein
MKKFIILLLIVLIAHTAWAQTIPPSNMNINTLYYDGMQTRMDANVSLKRVDDGYCLNITKVKDTTSLLPADRYPAGTMLYTSDVYLQDVGLYSFSPNGLNVRFPGWTEDKRFLDYPTYGWGEPNYADTPDNLSIIRLREPSGYSYYYRPYNYSTNWYGLHDGSTSFTDSNITVKPRNNTPYRAGLARTDSSRATGYEMQTFEVITYYVNKPHYESDLAFVRHTQVVNGNGPVQFFSTNDVVLLGCYAVQGDSGGVKYQAGRTGNEFVWLVRYLVTTDYPIIHLNSCSYDKHKKSIFDDSFNYNYYNWVTNVDGK